MPESAPRAISRVRWPRAALFGLGALLAVRISTLGLFPLIDTTESRYALVAADMAETGDWITPQIRIQGLLVPFEGKPPLHFWLSAAAHQILGRGEIAARIPSLLAGIVTVLLVLRLGARVVGVEAARAGALLLAMGPVFFGMAGTVALDLTLTASTTAGVLLGLGHDPRATRRERRRCGALMGIALGIGFLTKGPIALAVVGSAGIAVCIVRRSLDPLRGHAWITGGAALLCVAAPWFILSEFWHPGFLEYFFVQENWLRFTQSEIGDRFGRTHVYSPGISIVCWLAAALPALVAIAFASRASRKSGERDRWRRAPFVEILAASFALAIVLAPSSQVIVTYLVPAAPTAALAAGLAWTNARLGLSRLGAVAVVLALLLGIAHLVLEPDMTELRSTRDVITLARRIAGERGSHEIVFPRKTPWSAYYYGGTAVVPRPDDRFLLRIPETLALYPEAVFILKERTVRQLSEELAARLEIVDRTEAWCIAVRRN